MSALGLDKDLDTLLNSSDNMSNGELGYTAITNDQKIDMLPMPVDGPGKSN